jgi:hypothetical protein
MIHLRVLHVLEGIKIKCQGNQPWKLYNWEKLFCNIRNINGRKMVIFCTWRKKTKDLKDHLP